MKSLTEAEFRDVLRTAVTVGFERAIARAREAGLEFAPEPVELPERLEYRLGVTEAPPPRCPGAIVPEGCFFSSVEQKEASDRLAVARYNAYPGLRAAAERLIQRASESEDIRAVLLRLRDELARGPK